jgi:hypothetical protein
MTRGWRGLHKQVLHTLQFSLYRMYQEERSVLWEVIVLVIVSKKVYIYTRPIVNGLQDRAISLYTSTSKCTQMSNTPCPHTSCKLH